MQKNFSDDKTLNVVVEYHYIDFNKFEVTVMTAMCINDFRVSDGQFILEIIDENSSVLRRMERNKIKEISNN